MNKNKKNGFWFIIALVICSFFLTLQITQANNVYVNRTISIVLPFDQNLNTTDNVTFATVTASNVCYSNGSQCTATNGSGGGVSGSGTTNYLSKWTGSTSLGDSIIYEDSGSLYATQNRLVFGQGSSATDDDTVVIGSTANVYSQFGVAIGYNSEVGGTEGTALGYAARANYEKTLAVGYNAQAGNYRAMAVGAEAYASGYESVAVGNYVQATYDSTVAVGYGAQSSAQGASSVGVGSIASNNYANAYGYSAQATGENSNAYGHYAYADSEFSSAFGYSNAYNQYATVIGYLNEASGVRSFVAGSESQATGTNSFAFGNFVTATGSGSFAIGVGTSGSSRFWNNASNSLAVGWGNTESMRVDSSGLTVPDGKYIRIGDNNAGAPSSSDCDNDAERGRMSIDTTNDRLYICNGATRGWDYVALTN